MHRTGESSPDSRAGAPAFLWTTMLSNSLPSVHIAHSQNLKTLILEPPLSVPLAHSLLLLFAVTLFGSMVFRLPELGLSPGASRNPFHQCI